MDTIKKELGWESLTKSEHMDCIIHPIQKYIHNRRFPDLEIRKLTYFMLIMAGLMTREDALHKLENHPVDNCPAEILNLFLGDVGMTKYSLTTMLI